MNLPTLKELMSSGVHFGHGTSKWHPKMKPFIFTAKGGVHIINLEETQKAMEQALSFVAKTVAAGGTVLFLGTKKQAQNIVKEGALACGMPYVVSRWLGGTLTNAKSVLALAKKSRQLKEDLASGKMEKYTKKEKLDLTREMQRLEQLVGGIEKLNKIPDALFVLDLKHEKTAVKEAIRCKLPVVGICDSNVNPEKATYPIPGNDDATKAIQLYVNMMVACVNEAKASAAPVAKPVENKKS